jgi:TonB family protein
MRYFLPTVLACSSLLATPLFTTEKPRAPIADAQAQAGPAVPDSPAGLESQLEEILKIKNKKELKRREQWIGELRIPDPDAWFAGAFGNDDGEKLAATYKSTWEQFEDSFTNSVTNLAGEGGTHISVKEISLPAKPAVEGQSESVATGAKKPAVFYTAHAAKGSEPGSPLPGIYTYEQGAFRLVNWQTLYTLPYMKPTRIRIGGNVAAAKILKQVTPEYPAEARNKKVSGTVVLHVLLSREGYVARIDFVSGPPELMDASMKAVRQWKYQPTLLNGDPVEVDTTVAVQFNLK